MIPTAFDYERATSLDDALVRLWAADGAAKILAGGHSLLPLMKLRLSEPPRLIDIARLRELRGIREQGGRISIGAATTHHEVASSELLLARCPIIAETAATIGDQQVRNRGTIGGSLAHADPSADLPATMLALDAEIELAGRSGSRRVKAHDFFQGLFTVALTPEEIIVAVHVAPTKAASYAKLYQRASHYAIVGVAAALDASGGNITAARVGLTGATSHAIRLANVEQALVGKPATKETIQAATADAGAALSDVNDDLHASTDYRRAMVAVFTRRALEGALART